MKTFKYSVQINAPISVVFEKLTDYSSFPEWAKAWGEGMQCAGEWKEGENIFFTDPSGNGTMVVVEEIIPNERIRMKHIAMVENGNQEVTEIDEVMKKWIGSREDYFLKADSQNQTTFEMIGVVDESFEEMMIIWPQALQYFKAICETA